MRPDPNRRFVDKAQLKAVYAAGTQSDAHGFAPSTRRRTARRAAPPPTTRGIPKPGVRFIALDTISEGGVIAASADGNLDDPQYQWLTKRDHDGRSGEQADRRLRPPPDPLADRGRLRRDRAGCTRNDSHGHDVNPGCDRDPRSSPPIHLGADLQALFNAHPHVIAYVTGHTHENSVMACGAERLPGGANWWEINTASRDRLAAAEPPDRDHGQRATARCRSSARCSTTRRRTKCRPRRQRERLHASTSSARSAARSPYNDPQASLGATRPPGRPQRRAPGGRPALTVVPRSRPRH